MRARLSPCRIGQARREDPDATPARRVHSCSQHHADVVDGYRAARAVWEHDAETVTTLYRTELAEYRRANPAPTFRDWLQHNNGATASEPARPVGEPVTDAELVALGY